MKSVPAVSNNLRCVHAVRFYDNDESLVRLVARFITSGLADGQPAILIATSTHRQGILSEAAASIAVGPLMERGELIVLDAHEVLSTFMVQGVPDATLFERGFLGLIDKASARRRGCVVRVYGEMVDVLCKQGQLAAAIQLETLGNRLMRRRSLSILCGYSMHNIYDDGAFQSICHVHSHVMSINGVPVSIGDGGAI